VGAGVGDKEGEKYIPINWFIHSAGVMNQENFSQLLSIYIFLIHMKHMRNGQDRDLESVCGFVFVLFCF
jgi:hypothetical protein